MSLDRLWDLIRVYMKENELSIRGFARKCGVNQAYIMMIKDKRHPVTGKEFDPSVKSLRKIASGMDIELEELMRRVGYFE